MAWTELYVTTTGAGAGTGVDEANALDWAGMLAYGGTTALTNKRFNIKAGTYSRTTAADSFTATAGAPTAAAPMALRGYSSAIGDLEANGRADGLGALVLTNFPVVTYTTGRLTVPSYTIKQHLDLSSAINGDSLTLGTNCVLRRCRVRNTHGTGGAAQALVAGAVYAMVVDCDIGNDSTNAAAAVINMDRGSIEGCRIFGNGTSAAAIGVVAGSFCQVVGNVIFDLGRGVDTSALIGIIRSNSFRNIYGSQIRNSGNGVPVYNNAAWGTNGVNSRFIENVTSVRALLQSHNAVGNMGAADTNEGDWPVFNEVALTADPFTSASDFTPNSTAGGGAALKGVGLHPYLDIGAIQVQAAGGGLLVHPGMRGGMV